MEIYLIRHTTPDIKKGICYGQSDIPLKNTFPIEAKHLLDSIPQSFDSVYSSPLKRCAQLANLIDENYSIDYRLIEINFGDWELKKWEDITASEIKPWYDDFVNTACLNGESYIMLQSRVVAFFEEIIKKKHQKIAIVTHAGVIRSFLSFKNQIPLKDSFKEIEISYGEVFKIVI